MNLSARYLLALDAYYSGGEAEVRNRLKEDPELETLIGLVRGEIGQDVIGIPAEENLRTFSPSGDGKNWAAVLELHKTKKKWPIDSIGELDTSTTRIMTHLCSKPLRENYGHYGLVVGHVQSGKTSNYTALCSKAADSGYNLIIVLAGLYNDLREQTQTRLLRELTGLDQDRKDGIHIDSSQLSTKWIQITKKGKDFHDLRYLQPIKDTSRPMLIVTKKNVTPLRKLREWINNTDPSLKSQIKALIIDDESDHGSIDTQTGGKIDIQTGEHETSESAINRQVRKLLKSLSPGFSYIGYTATPMANVFINPEVDDERELGPSLYPNDFIISLKRPTGHFGLEDVHPPNGTSNFLDYAIPESEADSLRDAADSEDAMDKTELPESLVKALMQYFLSLAVKELRGDGNKHHSMLIHVKHTIETMKPLHRKVETLLRNWSLIINHRRKGTNLQNDFKKVWENSYKGRLDRNHSWEDVLENVKQTVAKYPGKYQVVEINSKSEDELPYEFHAKSGLRVIAIGGTRLSRGLTLEGLCISYFTRHARAHDTLLQMARWFGYRHGYQDLVRIHMTSPIRDDYGDMLHIEQSLRADIEEYEENNLSPADFGIRVMKHRKDLAPSGPLKMRHVELRTVNEDRKIFETPNLVLDNQDILDRNFSALEGLLSSMKTEGEECGPDSLSRIWTAPVDIVIDFLNKVSFPNSEYRMPIENRIIPYIKRRISSTDDELREWNIVCIGSRDTSHNRTFFTENESVTLNCVSRTRIPDSMRVGNSIAGPWDYVVDLTSPLSKLDRKDFSNDRGGIDQNKMFRARNKKPLLLVYLIDPNSTPRAKGRGSERERLFEDPSGKEPVVGIAMVLPSANISRQERDNERAYYILIGKATIEDIISKRSEND
jgi:hypothetical protein